METMETLTPEQTVLAIRALCPRTNGGKPVDTSPFHLSPCVCGVPMWQQPCLICGFYPDWGAKKVHTDAHIQRCKEGVSDPRAAFVKAVERAGNIAVWYISHWRRSAAWSSGIYGRPPTAEHLAFREAIEALESKAREIPCASPESIFDLVCDEGVKLPRFHDSDVKLLETLRDKVGTLSVYQAGKLRGLQDAGLVTTNEYLDLTDEGQRVVSDYNLEFLTDEPVEDVDVDDPMDGDHASALASAGMGTDEDYGCF